MELDNRPELHTIWSEAKQHIEHGDYDKAIETYKYILIRYADEDVAVEYGNAYLGDIYLTLRKLDLAENHIKKAINYNPEDPRYHYLLGFTYSVQRQWEKAIYELNIAVDKEPNNGEYLRAMGWAVNQSGNKREGLEYLHRAMDLAPTNVNILTDLAAAYLSDLHFDKARQYAKKATQIDPHSAIAKNVLDNITRFQSKYKRFRKP